MTVLVTGGRGNVGRHVVAELAALGLEGRAPGREELDFLRPETFAPAVRGAAGLFLLRPPPISRVGPTLNRLVDVAVAAGVRHVVLLSVIGAGRNPVVPHHRVERHLRKVGVGWTFLRPSFFAQNFGDAYREDIRSADRVRVPAGDGRVAFVDVRDVAELAARAFADTAAHAGRAYDLTGPEAVAFPRACALLSAELGRTIRYEPATVLGYARHLRAVGLPAAQVAVQTVLHTGLRRGRAERVDPALGQLLGRPPRSLPEYFRDHATLWR